MDRLPEISEFELYTNIQEGMDSIHYKQLLSTFEQITGPSIVVGTGGSKAAAEYTAKVLSKANGVITKVMEPRDVVFEDITKYKHLVGVTYGNQNHGLNECFRLANNLGLETLAITASKSKGEAKRALKYSHQTEKSFISQAATLTPVSLMLFYYILKTGVMTEGLLKIPKGLNNEDYNYDLTSVTDCVEIMSGTDTRTAEYILESTLTEAGLAIPLVHDKYSFCHGRSTHGFKNDHTLIYLINGQVSELDELLLQLLPEYYSQIIIMSSKVKNDLILGEYILAYNAMFLCRELAEIKNKSLKKVEYSPICRKIYKYQGELA